MNSVISAATIEARNSGWDVLGIMDGFEHLIDGRTQEARPLSITDVSRIHVQGGSIIRTSRANPTVRDEGAADPEWRLHACLESLRKLGIDALVTIGGDDTAFSASRLAGASGGDLRVAHVPKTIDNDLPLPAGAPTFGFETARSVGVQLVNNLMTDAITTQRWYLVVAMGRSAGHLALGIGKSAGATLTVIAEEFPRDAPIRLSRLVDVLETSMLKRIALGRPFGVAVLAEGIGLRLSQSELEQAMPEVERDEHGHVRLAQLELDRLLAKLVRDRFRERGQRITVEGKNIGYELRCAPPIPFDIEYTRDLGYAAVDYLKREHDQRGAMITIQEGHMVALPFGSFNDPETGRVRIRHVNVDSSSYHVAREYMIRLDWNDLEDPDKLRPIAAAAGLTPEAFRDRYGYLVAAPLGGSPPCASGAALRPSGRARRRDGEPRRPVPARPPAPATRPQPPRGIRVCTGGAAATAGASRTRRPREERGPSTGPGSARAPAGSSARRRAATGCQALGWAR
jgi:ATP-dependent phosphofructokinase / diphosphate-dependent phosphofructokinase